ncbi:ATP-binding protein [Silvimonas soli]|uniref:ATP-binding protein n=1 Tax=Silvimonas soli TaxID=2980100 RepID=UPI0024B352C9|nr:ATP-binding protein [Silvimonas soli]
MFHFPRSIAGRLLSYCLISLILIATVALGWGYVMARKRSEGWFDRRLQESAQLLLAFELDEARPNRLRSGDAAQLPTGPIAVQIWAPDGRLLFASPNAPAWPFTREGGFLRREFAGTAWRAYAQWDQDGDFLVRVMEDYHDHDQFMRLLVLRQVLTLLIGVPCLALALVISIRRGLLPLQKLSRDLDEFDPRNPQRFDSETLVAELQKPAIALNALLDRVDVMLEKERNFTADAAHELRTPFAALLVQAEVAQTSKDEARRLHALKGLQDGAKRGAHVVEQLLALARLDRAERLPREQFDLVNLCRNALGELAGQAAAKDQHLSFTAPPALQIEGHAVALVTALRNLVENAIRYCPSQSSINVNLQRVADGVQLQVEDNGPGIPEQLRARVLDRFFRNADAGEEGCGLGLSLVAQAVALHGGSIVLDQPQNQPGLVVRLVLPLKLG